MALCKFCENIDLLDVTSTTEAECPEQLRYDLQRPSAMRLSAQNGCSGCRFFLDYLGLEDGDTGAVGNTMHLECFSFLDFLGLEDGDTEAVGNTMPVQLEKRICFRSGAPSTIVIEPEVGLPTSHCLDVCLVQGTFHTFTQHVHRYFGS